MCYDVRYLTKKLADYEKRYGGLADLTEIARKIDPSYNPRPALTYHANAFSHVTLPLIRSGTESVRFYQWGLIPAWTKSAKEALVIQDKTLNARGEELSEKPSFKHLIRAQRCILLMDGFYEHHHRGRKTFPYHVQRKDRSPISMAGLWESWTDPDSDQEQHTVTIISTRGNALMKDIHNSPKLKGPRMPLMLDEHSEIDWLSTKAFEQEDVDLFLEPVDADELEAHPVRPLRGKLAVGNKVQATEAFYYQELQRGLFDM